MTRCAVGKKMDGRLGFTQIQIVSPCDADYTYARPVWQRTCVIHSSPCVAALARIEVLLDCVPAVSFRVRRSAAAAAVLIEL